MLAWLAEASPPETAFDGTLGSLTARYATDPDSPYRELKYSTQRTYNDDMRLLTRFVGARRLDRLTGEDFRRWYRRLKEPKSPGGPERARRAHGVLTMLRIILGYGRVLGLPHCSRLQDILGAMRFRTAPARKVFVTYAQVVSFIERAHALGFPEMALAQALQFEGTLRQVDVIGEWVPDPERPSGTRWANGLLWQDIRDGVMTKATTKTGAEAAIDFREYPLAMTELARVPAEQRVGPVIRDSRTGQPFRKGMYARRWRLVARAAGIPDAVWNRDSRAGGVTEGSDAGADLEALRHHASHSSVSTTARYSRRTLTKTTRVARLRVAHRKEPGMSEPTK
jgi:hypothetical protein